jgi:hypothetical protein
MRIKSETPDMLIIEDRPVVIALLLSAFVLAEVIAVFYLVAEGEWAGVAMLGLGIPLLAVAFIVFVRRTIVFLDRPGGMVTIRVASLIGQKENSLPLAEVTGAEVQTRRSSKGGSTHRPALRLTGGSAQELVTVYTSGGGAGRVVGAINRWLGTG